MPKVSQTQDPKRVNDMYVAPTFGAVTHIGVDKVQTVIPQYEALNTMRESFIQGNHTLVATVPAGTVDVANTNTLLQSPVPMVVQNTLHTHYSKLSSLKLRSKFVSSTNRAQPINIRKDRFVIADNSYLPTRRRATTIKVGSFQIRIPDIVHSNVPAAMLALIIVGGTFFVTQGLGYNNKQLQTDPGFAKESSNKNTVQSSASSSTVNQSSYNQLIAQHRQLFASLPTATSDYPILDVSSGAIIVLDDAHINTTVDFSNRIETALLYYYSFAGTIGTNAQSIFLVKDSTLQNNFARIVPGSRVTISGKDRVGNPFVWNYVFSSSNSYQNDSENFMIKQKSVVTFIVPASNDFATYNFRLVSVDKIVQ